MTMGERTPQATADNVRGNPANGGWQAEGGNGIAGKHDSPKEGQRLSLLKQRKSPDGRWKSCHWSASSTPFWACLARRAFRSLRIDTDPLFCDRCSRIVNPGRGEYYVIRIEAIADPTPASVGDEDEANPEEAQRELAALYERLKDLSEQEAMDQVFRRVVLHLCNSCYTEWIENPTNS